jgi:large subunit ribosomal protein L4
MKIDVYNISGEKTGRQVNLPDDIFGVEPNEHAVYLAVKQYLANQRQGTHKAKERGEIKGSTRKVKRQKGTGTARMGSLKNPLLRSGGRVFGPRPRDYGIKLNKKVKRLARKSAFSSKLSDGSLRVIEDFTFETPKTAEYANILNNFELSGKSNLLLIPEADNTLYMSARNIKKSEVALASSVSTYQLLNASTVLLSEGAIAKIKETF